MSFSCRLPSLCVCLGLLVEAPKKPEDERFLHDEGWVEDFGGDKGLAGAIADLKVRFHT